MEKLSAIAHPKSSNGLLALKFNQIGKLLLSLNARRMAESQEPSPVVHILNSLHPFEGLNLSRFYTKLTAHSVYPVNRMGESGNQNSQWCRQLYEEHAAGLLLYGRALGLGHAESEDVIQETFLALLKLEDTPSNARHYLIRAFRNRALNCKRGLFRRLARELESKRWFEISPDENPLERAAMETLTSLPRDQKEVVVLKVWNQMTFEAIGELLNISPNTAAGRYRYGVQKLRDRLSRDAYVPERNSPFGEPIKVLETA